MQLKEPRPDLHLLDGDQVGRFPALAVPGHTPGGAAYYLPEPRNLVTGDPSRTPRSRAESFIRRVAERLRRGPWH
jgi:hypothetical protein